MNTANKEYKQESGELEKIKKLISEYINNRNNQISLECITPETKILLYNEVKLLNSLLRDIETF